MALQNATNAAIPNETSRAGPAIPAAGAIAAKIPAPRMAASPALTAAKNPSCGRRRAPLPGLTGVGAEGSGVLKVLGGVRPRARDVCGI